MSVAVRLLRQVVPSDPAPRDRRALRDWVLRRLYEAIFSGEFPPGITLSENDLAERLDVSRQPIRDALRQLETDGLIEEAAGNGARKVVVFELHHVIEIYTIRAALEAVSFRGAAANITDDQLAELEQVQAELEERLDRGDPAPGEWDATPDFRFHEIVAEAAAMPQLHAFLVNIWLKTWALLNQVQIAGTYPNVDDLADSYRDRRRLLEALRSRDGDRASAAVIEHVNHRRDQLVSAIESRRGRFRFPT
ncbi:GntR family transcriptional regulator [Nocardioides immobilis]|uniref:GntR family transcriptional regulator n=1 Tax=Nocardioides immobilis TaxID=2049295 RepID=A0A417Y7J4_9ACTN|nr:GntR family transcriptional regulator [Nocardioides immobilis]RHW28436.1 GntR family transcriptional regulator [Nocardioides immobilis]